MKALARIAVGFALIATLRGLAAEEPVPVRHEPKHKVVLENDYVRVIDVRIPAGEQTLFHVHEIESVIVYLTKSTNETQPQGETKWSPRAIVPGEVRYAAYDQKPLTHRVRNPGPSLFRVYDIELTHKPVTAEAFTLPDTPALKAHWQEKAVRALTLRLDPGAHRTLPPSACAYLFVGIGGELTVSPVKGAPQKLQPQAFSFQPAQTGLLLTNAGTEATETVVLELR